MKVTIKTVAAKAGVSISTVSRVLNNTVYVDDEKRSRVKQAIQDLGYKPNQAARRLINKQTNSIGLILPGIYGEYFSELIKGMDNVASMNNYDFLISNLNRNNPLIEKNFNAMYGRVDGVIIMYPSIAQKEAEDLLSYKIPTLFFNSLGADYNANIINVNNFDGAFKIVKHLIEHGYKKIAIIKGDERSYDAKQRLEGYRLAISEIDGVNYKLEVNGNFSIESGYKAVKEIFNNHDLPKAIFASNDAMAVGAIKALKEVNLRIPEDVAVVGFDDIPMVQYLSPRLTTIRTDLQKTGERLIKKILEIIKMGNLNDIEKTFLSYELVVRESCGIH